MPLPKKKNNNNNNQEKGHLGMGLGEEILVVEVVRDGSKQREIVVLWVLVIFSLGRWSHLIS